MKDSFARLVEVLYRLRGDGGCSWDKVQNLETMKKLLLSEAQEVAEAVEKKDYENLREELGDLLFDLLSMALIAEENRLFDVKQMLDDAADKLIRRHPHVFADAKASTPEEAYKLWMGVKAQEKKLRQSRKKN